METKQRNGGRTVAKYVLACGIAAGGASLPARAADNAASPKPEAKPAAAAAAAAAAKPANNQQAAVKAVQSAVAALLKEYQAHAQDAKTPLREKSNYFSENPSSDVTPEVIVQALLSKAGPDASSDSYVKWQLLSAVPGKFDEKLAPTAAHALLKAERPAARPGIAMSDRRQLDPMLRQVKSPEDVEQLNKKLDELVASVEEKNKPVIAYRDELYSKLPAIPDALVARLQDCAQRGETGIDCNIPLKQVIDDIALWSSHDTPAAQCQAMAQQVHKILLDKMGGMQPKAAGGNTGGAGYRGGNMRGGYGNRGGAGNTPNTPNTPNVNGGGQMTGAGYSGAGWLPSKYYDRVEFNSEKKIYQWHEGNARFVSAQDVSDLVTTLEDAAKASKGGGAMKKS